MNEKIFGTNINWYSWFLIARSFVWAFPTKFDCLLNLLVISGKGKSFLVQLPVSKNFAEACWNLGTRKWCSLSFQNTNTKSITWKYKYTKKIENRPNKSLNTKWKVNFAVVSWNGSVLQNDDDLHFTIQIHTEMQIKRRVEMAWYQEMMLTFISKPRELGFA